MSAEQLRILADLAVAALARLTDPECSFRVVDVVAGMNDVASAIDPQLDIRIVIETDNRAAVLGQYAPFRAGGLLGYHSNYVFGYIHGRWEASGLGDLWTRARLTLDVRPTGAARSSVYRYVPTEELVTGGWIDGRSPMAAALTRFGARYALVAGPTLVGPSLAMMEAVEAHTSQDATVLDVFAGAWLLSLVALSSGAARSTAIDLTVDASVAAANLGGLFPRCEFVAGDVFTMTFEHGRWDLAVIDPFYGDTDRAVTALIPLVADRADITILNLGSVSEHEWLLSLHHSLRRVLPRHRCAYVSSHGEQVALIRSESRSEK